MKTIPKVRHSCFIDVSSAFNGMLRGLLVNDKITDTHGKGIFESCLSCFHFNEKQELCVKYNNQRPPARIIAFGCSSYEDCNDIPF